MLTPEILEAIARAEAGPIGNNSDYYNGMMHAFETLEEVLHAYEQLARVLAPQAKLNYNLGIAYARLNKVMEVLKNETRAVN